MHREDEPSVTTYYENGNVKTEIYYYNGELHRKHGPAFVSYHKDGTIKESFYYIYGVLYEDLLLYYLDLNK